MFHPTSTQEVVPKTDSVVESLIGLSRLSLIVVCGLLPIFFIPGLAVTLDLSKTLFAVVGVSLSLVLYALYVLRVGSFSLSAPAALYALWGVVGVNMLSAFFSNDRTDAFFGTALEVHTVGFLLLMATLATLVTVVARDKVFYMRMYMVLTGSAFILIAFHVSRIIFGPELFSFQVFTNAVSSPIGGWNSLGIFLGLVILLILVALEQLPLTHRGKIVSVVMVVLSLLMLGVINFYSVWLILGLASLVMILYGLAKDKFQQPTLGFEARRRLSGASLLVASIIFIFSLSFVLVGGGLGSAISRVTEISYLEVRPSISATADIARNVFENRVLFGSGPNSFVDAWRLHKDIGINETIFWNVDFLSGYSYILTQFVTVGVLGSLAWLVFLSLFVVAGFKMLSRGRAEDKFWYFIGSSSFVGGLYLWVIACFYAPSSSILLLAAIFSGVLFAALAEPAVNLPGDNEEERSPRVFLFIGCVLIVLGLAVGAVYTTVKITTANHHFGVARTLALSGAPIEEAEARITLALDTFERDLFAREMLLFQIAKLNALANRSELTQSEQQEFERAVVQGVFEARRIMSISRDDANNPLTAGVFYSLLSAVGLEEAREQAVSSFARARELNPNNPLVVLLEAQFAARVGDQEGAKRLALEAISLKRNYAEGYELLTTIEIASGNLEEAITSARALATMEPNNPAIFYQLGVLEAARGGLTESKAAFTNAIALDTNFANARFMLARIHLEEGDMAAALAELRMVLELNPENQEIVDLIASIEAGEIPAVSTLPDSITPEADFGDGQSVTADESPDSSLISPVNTPPSSN